MLQPTPFALTDFKKFSKKICVQLSNPHFFLITFIAAQFEGSLGRLTAASVHNPRQIIDVCRTVSPTGEESGKKSVSKELRRYRQLLMDIEKVCIKLLII